MIGKVLKSLGGVFKEARRRGIAVVIADRDLDVDLPNTGQPACGDSVQGGITGDHCRRERALAAPDLDRDLLRTPRQRIARIALARRRSQQRRVACHAARRRSEQDRQAQVEGRISDDPNAADRHQCTARVETCMSEGRARIGVPEHARQRRDYPNIVQCGFEPIQMAARITRMHDEGGSRQVRTARAAPCLRIALDRERLSIRNRSRR